MTRVSPVEGGKHRIWVSAPLVHTYVYDSNNSLGAAWNISTMCQTSKKFPQLIQKIKFKWKFYQNFHFFLRTNKAVIQLGYYTIFWNHSSIFLD